MFTVVSFHQAGEMGRAALCSALVLSLISTTRDCECPVIAPTSFGVNPIIDRLFTNERGAGNAYVACLLGHWKAVALYVLFNALPVTGLCIIK